jgi:hypothetical protein
MNNSSNFQKEEEKGNADFHLELSQKYMDYKDLADRCHIDQSETGK